MKMMSIKISKIILFTMIDLFICVTEVFCVAPMAPVLRIVQPYYSENSPLKMYLEWDTVAGALGYEIHKMAEEEYIPVGVVTPKNSNEPVIGAFDPSSIVPGTIYAYWITAIFKNGKQIDSNTRENWVEHSLWPVTKHSDCSDDEGFELLHNFNQPMDQQGLKLHDGIDLLGQRNIDGECVRAPLGGVIKKIFPINNNLNNMQIEIEVLIDDKKYGFIFAHLVDIPKSIRENNSVSPGQFIGKISSKVPNWRTEKNHTHLAVIEDYPNDWNKQKNPLEYWNVDEQRDPQLLSPQLEDTNADFLSVLFRNKNRYFKPSELSPPHFFDFTIYGAIDIVVEATDHQSLIAPWTIPKNIGYYIQRVTNSSVLNVVRSSAKPYMLINSTNWFGDVYKGHQNLLKTLFDSNPSLAVITPRWYTSVFKLWNTFIVTNTKGTEGKVDDLDANQCWATDVQKNDNDSPNGCRAGYRSALTNQDARFPDGKYQIGIRLEDYVHTYPNVTDHLEPVIVDNFVPYIEQVTLTSSDTGRRVYQGGWTPQGAQLIFSQTPGEDAPRSGVPLHVAVTASETMRDVSFRFDGQPTTTVLKATDDEQMIWEGDMAIPDALTFSTKGELQMVITGHDTAENPLLDFADSSPKFLPKRSDSGAWYCPLAVSAAPTASRNASPAPSADAPQPTCTLPSDAGDTAHRLVVMPPISTWKLTTPGKSVCFEEDGGIICELGASEQGDPTSSTTGLVKLRPKTAAPQAVGSQSLLLEDDGASRAEHAGIHFLPAGDIEFIIEPGAQEMELCPAKKIKNDCSSAPIPETRAASLTWSIEKTVNERLCQVTARLNSAVYQLDIQPSALCQSVRERSETFDASAECGWSVGSIYDLEPLGTFTKEFTVGARHSEKKYEGCDFYDWKWWFDNVDGSFWISEYTLACKTRNDSWGQTEWSGPGGRKLSEDGFGKTYVTIPIHTRITCEWKSAPLTIRGRVSARGIGVLAIPVLVRLDGGAIVSQESGVWENCVAETLYQRYRPLVECTYTMEATRLQLPDSQRSLTIPLHPGEPDAAP